jgi:DNA topoisomerase-1
MAVTLEDAIALIEEKRKQDVEKHLKVFVEDDKLEIMNGRYGPYLVYEGKNYRLPKNLHDKAVELTYDECMKIVNK